MAPTAEEWHDALPESDVPDRGVREILVAGRSVVVGRAAGTLFAVDACCPHAGGPLGEASLEGSELVCPLHGYAFDVHTGACLDDPGLPLERFEIRVREGVVQVRFAS